MSVNFLFIFIQLNSLNVDTVDQNETREKKIYIYLI